MKPIPLLKKLNTRIFSITALFFIPVFLLFLYGIHITSLNVKKSTAIIDSTIPRLISYHHLEQQIMQMQKWITYTCATRAEKGYDNGIYSAEKSYNETIKTLNNLKKLFKHNTVEYKEIEELERSIINYYNVGIEVTKAYIANGTFYGNAMLEVFSIVEKELDTNLKNLVSHFTKKTLNTTKSLYKVLTITRIAFIVLGFFVIVLSITSYLFFVKRAELRESNKKLSEAMDSLWGEMQLAKKIQTVLLPNNPEIDGFEIKGYMVPADDVGGDYYDIINSKERDWVVIGDVSGHGVPAGLVMMMAQTAIHTVVNHYPNISPSELITTINHSIKENLLRLEEDKYMTLTVFAYNKNGNFTYSGLHQDLMIYRKSSGKVEILESRGMWIGLLPDLKDMNIDDSLHMNTGDVLLLYTDGVTESLNTDGNMFSDERLLHLFENECNKENYNVKSIKNKIDDAMSSYTAEDDITMVIIKRI